jgi:uncharacterized protein YkwD
VRKSVVLTGVTSLLLAIGGTTAYAATDDPAVGGSTEATTRPPNPNDPLERGLLDLVNAERARVGCPAVKDNDRLNGAARFHSSDMVRRNYINTVTPEGVTPAIRIANEGYVASASGENILRHADTPEFVLTFLKEDHANLYNCQFVDVGIGVASENDGTNNFSWTLDFAAPR